MKLEILITHIIPSSCYRKKLQNLFHLNCVLQVGQIWIQLITAVWDYCKKRCYKSRTTGLKSGEFRGHSRGGINSGVFYNDLMVTRAQWAFQVSQGSVETLFRWGGKSLHHFWANLFRKLYTRYHQIRPSFIGENILVSFFRTQCIILYVHIENEVLETL